MKIKNILFLILVSLCFNVNAQVIEYNIPANLQSTDILNSKYNRTKSAKNSATVELIDSTYLLESRCPWDSLLPPMVFEGTTPDGTLIRNGGYITGTQIGLPGQIRDTQTGQVTPVTVTQRYIGQHYEVKRSPNAKVYLSKIYIAEHPNYGNPMFYVNQMNLADTFNLYVFEGDTVVGPYYDSNTKSFKQIATTKFDSEKVLESFEIKLPARVEIPEQVFFAIDVRTDESNDTIALWTNDFRLKCGKQENRCWYRLGVLDKETNKFIEIDDTSWSSFYKKFKLTYEGEPVEFDADVLFLPVYDIVTSNSRPGDEFVENGSFRMYLPYPNPAVDVTNVKFTLNNPSAATLQLMDLQGRVLFEQKHSLLAPGEHIMPIEVANYSCGIYHVILKTDTDRMGIKLNVVK